MKRYLAFISYRHTDRDQKISALLRRGLEYHQIPENERVPKNRRVFRDTDELPTSSDLGEDIENALKDSAWLIALCSEEYVQSKWCMREIDEFLLMGRKDRILPVLVSGDPTKAVPEKIRDIPIAADLRDCSGRELRKRIQTVLPGLLSRMSGIEPAKIMAAQRKKRFMQAAVILVILIAGVLGFAFYAIHTANRIDRNNEAITEAAAEAQKEEKQAIEERNNALEKRADYYAGQAWNAIKAGDDELALQMALSALPEDLHGDEPVSESALNAIRTVLNLPSAVQDAYHLLRSMKPEEANDQIPEILRNTVDGVIVTDDPPSDTTKEEVLAGLGLTKEIRSAAFSHSSAYLAVVDEEGTLRILDTDTGEAVRTAKGKYSFVTYPYASDVVLAVTQDGLGMLIDVYGMETITEFISPSPISQLWYCQTKKTVLAGCADGFRIYSFSDGKLKSFVPTKKKPNQVIWDEFDDRLFLHEGNTILVLYDDGIDLYSLNTENDATVSDALIIYREDLMEGCRSVFYSPDGKYLYTEAKRGSLYKWDAVTGDLVWKNEISWGIQASTHDEAALSLDGTAIWRFPDYTDASVEKIDAETGETLFLTESYEYTSPSGLPEESADAKHVFLQMGSNAHDIISIDPDTGETLWRTDYIGEAWFSEDSKEIHSLEHFFNRKEWTDDYIFRKFDAASGDLIEETVLLSLESEYWNPSMSISKENRLAVLIVTDREDSLKHVINTIDLETKEIVSYAAPSEESLYACFPYDGGAALYWTENETDYICRLNPDGSLSNPNTMDSLEGIRLHTSAGELEILNEESVIRQSDLSEKEVTLTRLNDGKIVLDLQRNSAFRCVVSPDGESFCVYGNDLPPTLIRMTDADTLVEKAKKRLEDMRE